MATEEEQVIIEIEDSAAPDVEPEEIDFVMDEAANTELALDDVAVDEEMEMTEEQAWAYKILRRAATLKGVTIKRDTFLRTELSKKCSPEVVEAAIATNPQAAGVSLDVIDDLADAAISIETRKVSGLSALAGLPGGLAMFGTIPADIIQYFAHSLRIEQKLAYLYGWESFLNDEDEVDDETMYRLILFLGVMMQVGSLNVSLTKFASQTAKVGVAKAIQKQALTKTAWYTPLKKVLGVIGVKVTKSSFAEAVAKGVPVIGGVVSGGLTYATFKPGAVSLKKYLRVLPQATGVVLSDEEMEEKLKLIEAESQVDYKAALGSVMENVGAAAGVAAESMGAAAGIAAEAAGVAAEKTGVAARAAAAGIKRGFGGLTARFGGGKKPAEPTGMEKAAEQLRALKGLLDDGIITQDDFDAKKKELLGL